MTTIFNDMECACSILYSQNRELGPDTFSSRQANSDRKCWPKLFRTRLGRVGNPSIMVAKTLTDECDETAKQIEWAEYADRYVVP